MSKEKIGKASCLLSIIASTIALVIYPAAKWLFFVPVVFVATLFIASRFRKDPSPSHIADFAEKLLNGEGYGWDVDDYEHLNPKNRAARDLWAQTMSVGGLPEEWPTRDDLIKDKLRKLISSLRELESFSP